MVFVDWLIIAIAVLGAISGAVFGFKTGKADKYGDWIMTCMLAFAGMLTGGMLGAGLGAIIVFLPIVMGALIAAAFVIFKMEKVRKDYLKTVNAKAIEENNISRRRLSYLTSWDY